MANTININIRNCCCCGGGISGAPGTEIVPIDEWPDPTTDEGPPEGYGEPSTLEDRQCKTAVFLYYWLYYLIDTAANTTVGNMALNFLSSQSIPTIAKDLLAKWISPAVFATLVSLSTFGIEITDGLQWPIAFIVSRLVFGTIADIFINQTITVPLMEDAFAKLPNAKDLIICKLSLATTPAEAYAELEKVLMDPSLDLSFTQRKVMLAFMPGALLNLLYWSADWWPSFETETLVSITETCCGDMEEGQPLLPGSVDKCTAANFVIDQLIELFYNTGEYIQNYYNFNIFDVILDMEGEIYDDMQINLTIPTKIGETAYNIDMYLRYVAKYMASVFINWNPLDNLASDTTFLDLSDYLIQNNAIFVCTLYNASDVDSAYVDLHNIIKDWLDEYVTDEEQNGYLDLAIQGLIHSQGDFINLLFVQDTDLLGYSGIVDCAVCSGGGCSYVVVRGTETSPGNFSSEFVRSGGLSGLHYITINYLDCGAGSGSVELLTINGETAPEPGDNAKIYRARSNSNAGNECDGWDIYCDNTPPTGALNGVVRYQLTSRTAFTVELDIS